MSDNLESRIVNKASEWCEGFILADPVDPENSLLYRKLTDEPGCGDTMPPSGIEGPTPEEIVAIRDWISGLAVPAEGSCAPRETRVCEIGNPAWWSACEQPEQTCSADGERWGECEGPMPSVENCNTPEDEDCNPGTPANSCSPDSWSFAVARDRSQLFESVGVDQDGNVYVLGNFEGVADFGRGDLASDEPKGQYKNDVFLGKYDKFGTPLWTKDFGDSSNQYAPRMAINRQTGDIAVLVRLFGGINFGGDSPTHTQKGSGDIVVAVLDADGNHKWSQHLGGRSKDRAERIAWATDNGDLLVTGKVGDHRSIQMKVPGKGAIDPKGKADALVIRFDSQGDVRWHALLGGDQLTDAGKRLQGAGERCDPKDGDNYRRCGGCGAQHCDPETRTWSKSCAPIANPDGTQRFSCSRADLVCSQEPATAGLCVSGDDDYAWGAVTDKKGDVYVAGRFEGYMNFPRLDGGRKTARRAANGALDIFVVKLDGATGNPLWSRHYGGYGDDRAYDIALQPRTGNLIITGYFTGSVNFGGKKLTAKGGPTDDDIFVLSLKPGNGATAWARGYGDKVTQFGHNHELGKTTRQISLEVDGRDNIYLGGSLYGSFDGRLRSTDASKGPRPDPFFAKLSPSGKYLNGRVHGSSTSEFGADLALDPTTNSILMVGHSYADKLDFGNSGTVLGIKNRADAWIAKFPLP